jgi:6-pyruvoyltetrahydropterin/6-carboxytetrahydropterin synthase
MHIVELSCEFTYEAAHQLPYVPPGHKCGRMHGHSYRLTVTVRGPVREDGFVIDFSDVKAKGARVVDSLDHRCLNHLMPNPTVEWQLEWIWQELRPSLPELHELKLRETSKNSATYRGES